MLCPLVSIGRKDKAECDETKCAFWCNHECVIAGFMRSFVRGEAPERYEPGL